MTRTRLWHAVLLTVEAHCWTSRTVRYARAGTGRVSMGAGRMTRQACTPIGFGEWIGFT